MISFQRLAILLSLMLLAASSMATEPTVKEAKRVELKPVCKCSCVWDGANTPVQFDCSNSEKCQSYDGDECLDGGELKACRKAFVWK